MQVFDTEKNVVIFMQNGLELLDYHIYKNVIDIWSAHIFKTLSIKKIGCRYDKNSHVCHRKNKEVMIKYDLCYDSDIKDILWTPNSSKSFLPLWC